MHLFSWSYYHPIVALDVRSLSSSSIVNVLDLFLDNISIEIYTKAAILFFVLGHNRGQN